MTHYFFHLRNAHDRILDEVGREIESLADVSKAALHEARGVLAADAMNGHIDLRQRIEVEDGAGEIVFSMPLRDAIEIHE